jgi:sialate O-acetylesterase
MKTSSLLLFFCIGIFSNLCAKISTPAIFGSNMVLQQNHACPVWGKAEPSASISLSFAGKTYQTKANEKGDWRVTLDPHPATSYPLIMNITEESSDEKKSSNSLTYENILVGEVWLCSGQSNMQWSVRSSDDSDLESLSAHYPNLRLITVPQVGSQEPQYNFKGAWEAATPHTAANFSAVGYFFGRRLHQILQVPVGLIDNSWGGSACEAWIPRDRLQQCKLAKPYLKEWQEKEKNYDYDKQLTEYKNRLTRWEAEQKNGNTKGQRPREPRNQMTGQHRPANLYNGVLHPVIGYGIKGTIWYQGESNGDRAHAYREVFPLMIQSWRQAWGQGDFPFYWTQLADFRNEVDTPGDSNWAELRESQTLTLQKLRNVGEAVIIDAGEGRDIHPRNKQIVANRLLRHALVNEYGHKIPNRSPIYKSHEIMGNKIQINFDHSLDGLYCFDTKSPIGFAISGTDQKFVWAEAKLIGKDKVEVWADSVSSPVAVRYAWSDNPVCNLYSKDGAVTLPATPFRTDNFPLSTIGK